MTLQFDTQRFEKLRAAVVAVAADLGYTVDRLQIVDDGDGGMPRIDVELTQQRSAKHAGVKIAFEPLTLDHPVFLEPN